jgi:hypothetical protein
VSVVNLLPVEYSYSVDAISDTPIFNALAATRAPFSRPVAAHAGPAALTRSCVMPRSPRMGGGRHHRLSSHADFVPGGGRHRLVVAANA